MFRVLSENGHLARRPWFKSLSYYQQGRDDPNKDFTRFEPTTSKAVVASLCRTWNNIASAILNLAFE